MTTHRAGDEVWILCAKVDPYGVNDETSEPAIDTRTFGWLRATVTGEAVEDECMVRIVGSDANDATTYYESRFLLTGAQAAALLSASL